MNVFRYEMRQHRKSLITWAVVMAAAAFILLSATPMFIEESSGMRDMISSFPDAVKDALGIDIDTFLSAVGFYSYIFLYMQLAAAIQAMSVGLNLLSKENRMKTADFLMSKPMRRSGIFGQKLLAALCVLLVTEGAFFISAAASMALQTAGDFNVRVFILISLTFTFAQLFFLALGLFLASVKRKIGSVITLAMGVCFGTFIVGMIGSITGGGWLRIISPLKYFDNSYILSNASYEPSYMALWGILTAALAVAAYIVYIKKDIHAVT